MTGLGAGMALPKWYSNSTMFQRALHRAYCCNMHVVYTLADPGKPHGVAFLQWGPFIEVQQGVHVVTKTQHIF